MGQGGNTVNWKAEAVEKLRRYDAMCRAVRNLPVELDRLEAEYTALGSGLRVHTLAGRDERRQEDRLMDNLMARQQLKWSLNQALSWTEVVNNALSALEPEERLILHRLYILPQVGALAQLSEKLGVEKSSIYRRRDKALNKFTLSLYGAQESN